MGRLADSYGTRWTVITGSVMIASAFTSRRCGAPGSSISATACSWALLGNAGLNAPLYVYVSRWFDRRRGSALALISSGGYLAGFVWPTVFERSIAFRLAPDHDRLRAVRSR